MFQSYFATTRTPHKTFTLGLVFSAIIFLALFFTDELRMVFFLTLLLGIALAAVDPILMGKFTPYMPKQKVGEYSAILFATKSLAAAFSPLLAGFIADAIGLNYVFLVGFVILAGLFVFRKHVLA